MLHFLVCTVSKRAKAKKVMWRMGLGDGQEGVREQTVGLEEHTVGLGEQTV